MLQGKIVFVAPTKPLLNQQVKACYEKMSVSQVRQCSGSCVLIQHCTADTRRRACSMPALCSRHMQPCGETLSSQTPIPDLHWVAAAGAYQRADRQRKRRQSRGAVVSKEKQKE